MPATQITDWTNYIRFSDDEFEMLRRAGVEGYRIDRMKETRERYDRETER